MRLIIPAAAALLLAACATASTPPPPSTGTPTAGFWQSAKVGDVLVTPIELIEDSRCPANARCVWEGRLILDVDVHDGGRSSRARLQLGSSVDNVSGTLGLAEASPLPVAGQPKPSLSDYRFTFTFARRDEN